MPKCVGRFVKGVVEPQRQKCWDALVNDRNIRVKYKMGKNLARAIFQK